MITEKIKKDVSDEFINLKESLQIHLDSDLDVSQTKQFLQTHTPKEVFYKSEILLNTLLNYLMADARERIKAADIKLQNAFFDADFRKRIHEWVGMLKNQLTLKPNAVQYTFDPRLKQGLIASGIAFVIGAGVTSTVASGIVGTIVTGIITIMLSVFSFKVAYNHASLKAREAVKADVDRYLDISQKQVFEWLAKVEATFEKDFYTFCSANGFSLEKDSND